MYTMEVRRPLKRPKLGPPDIYPQDPKQKEDELTQINVKQGYTSPPLINGPNSLDEFGTAKNANIEAFGVYFSALLSEKHRINTLKDTQKKKQLVNTKEIWCVHAKTKNAVDNWFRDLANGTKSLGQLGKRIPTFNSKEGMFSQLFDSHVPLTRAVWFIKMTNVHHIALTEQSSKSKKRQPPDQCQELTSALCKYLKELSAKLHECYQHSQHQIQQHHNNNKNKNNHQHQPSQAQQLLQSLQQSLPNEHANKLPNNSQSQSNFISNLHTSVAILVTSHTASASSLSTTSLASLPITHEEFLPTYAQWQYQTQLARYLFDEGLLDQYDFLCFLLELIEKKRPFNDLLVKVICPLILEYVIDFSRSAVLSRRLANVCAKKLCQAFNYYPMLAKQSVKRAESSSSSSSNQVKVPLTNNLNNSFINESNSITKQAGIPNKCDSRVMDSHSSSNSLLKSNNSSATSNANHLTPSNSLLYAVKSEANHSPSSNIENTTNVKDQEKDDNNLYKTAIHILSSILQVICIECPTAMVRHHLVDAKYPSAYQGSPLDQLPCLPSELPIIESDLNNELKKTIQNSEQEILFRSAMTDSKWSCDRSGKFETSKVNLGNRLLTVMDILDKHNFDKIDSINSIELLYTRIFPPELSKQNSNDKSAYNLNSTNQSLLDTSSALSSQTCNNDKKNKQLPQSFAHPVPSFDSQNCYNEQVIKLLCEWATTTQRTGEHRALVVASLLEKRQSDLQEFNKAVINSTNNKTSVKTEQGKSDELSSNQKTEPQSDSHGDQADDTMQFIFQDLLVKFLDENAPVIDSGQEDNLDNKKAFNNLVLLFSELIRCDVFSHYNYMCTLISRGMFNDLSKGSSVKIELANNDSPAPNSNLNQPASVKQPKSIGNDSDSLLASSLPDFSNNSNIYPSIMVNTSSNHLDPLSNNKVSSNADQSLRSLGFSPVSSQQNMSQDLDKSQGMLDNHIDDVDADLKGILQVIKEGQQDEAADILLPDYLGDSATKIQQPTMNKLSPFELGDRPSNLDSSLRNASRINSFPPSIENKPTSKIANAPSNEKLAKKPVENRHFIFVKHFPVPDDETFAQDMNQRNILLYGFGKEREDARHSMKKLHKEIKMLLHRKVCRDINDSGKIKKLTVLEGFNPETIMYKFESLYHHDQHIITNSLATTIMEMFTGVANGSSWLLPPLESLSFIFDLFTVASNVSGLLDLIVPILERLPEVEAQIKLKCTQVTHQYTHSIALCIIGMLNRYHSCLLLLSKDELCSIFESLYKLVSHLPNPVICTTSTERVIFYYLYELYTTQTGRYLDQFTGIIQRIKPALQSQPPFACPNIEHDWTPTLLQNIFIQMKASHLYSNSSTNPILNAGSTNSNFNQANPTDLTATIRQQLYMNESPTIRQINDVPSFRYRFVCDAIYSSATSPYPDLVNDLAVLCTDVTSKCPALIHEWIFALQALCCSAQRDSYYRQLFMKINISDPLVMDNIAIFMAVLVARRCLELDKFIIQCAIGAILAPLSCPNDRQHTEPGVRLTCHLLLCLFRNRESHVKNQSSLMAGFCQPPSTIGGNGTPNYAGGFLGQAFPSISLLQPVSKDPESNIKCPISLKYLCDHYLLRSACCSIKTECHITLLKAIRVLAMLSSPSNDPESLNRVKTENHFDDASMDGFGNMSKDLDGKSSPNGGMNSDSSFNMKHINLQTASLHQFADAILRILCSQRWLHDKCLSDSEIFTTIDTDKNILLDPRIDVKQSQRLLYMICYNKSPERQADIGLDDQGSDQVASIVKMFENLNVWSMRLSLMRLQFMFAYCKSQSTSMLNEWLDNLAKAVVDFFQKASQEHENQDADESTDPTRKIKNMKPTSFLDSSITNINRVWLIEPLLDKLTKPPSAIQGKIIKASAALMESASVRANSLPSLNQTYLSTAAASTKFKERTLSQRGSNSTNPSNLASTSLLGFQPFLSLLLSCLRNQDKEKETLLTSLNSQLYQAIHEKVDDIGYKQSLQDGLELRLCLIGQMFDTIQKSPNLTSDWATLLLLLIVSNLVDPQVDYSHYVAVLDMLATLIQSAYAADPLEQREDCKKQYQNLMKKFRKELAALEEKGFVQMRLIYPLMPIARQMIEVITCEPMGSLVDTKGEKVENFYSIDKKKGLKVSEIQLVNPWELIEGHKNPAPLSWPWFGAIRLEQKPLRSDENNRLMSWHTHTVPQSTAYHCEVPNLDGCPSTNIKKNNSEKKPSQTNPLLKSLIEATDESSILSKKETEANTHGADDETGADNVDDHLLGREDILEENLQLPVEILFDSKPIETMIEAIKNAMQAEQAAALSAKAKSAATAIDAKPPIGQTSSILAQVQPDSTRSSTPQVSALKALQSHLNVSSSTDTSMLGNSGPNSVPSALPCSPIINPHTPELMPARPPSNLAKINPTPPPPISVVGRSMSPMVARSPAIPNATPPPLMQQQQHHHHHQPLQQPIQQQQQPVVIQQPQPKPRAPRQRKRATKKETALANAALIDANANVNKNGPLGIMATNSPSFVSSLDSMNLPGPQQLVINQPKLVQNSKANQLSIHPMQQQQHQPPQPNMMIRRGVPTMVQQQKLQQQQQQQQAQSASVYDFQYQPPTQAQQSNQFVNSGPMNNYYEQQAPATQIFSQNQAQQPQQGGQQMQLGMQQHPHHPPPQAQQHMHQSQHHPHQVQYQAQQHQAQTHLHMQPQQIRLPSHQHPQPIAFQSMQQQQPQGPHGSQPMFAPQQAAGHSRPALATMLHQKHAAAGNTDNKMHQQQQQPRFGFQLP